ncbi:MAG: transporter substrate-binding domain-containing protein, partial [Verrucomicrobia bacterium]|nr:transporter substrate-binding domain-containing protein [Verrucomicrobiota bacterium]
MEAQTKTTPPAPIVRVGIETGNNPLSHTNAQGQPSGFLIDLIQAIAKERNLQPVVDYRPWDVLMGDFKAGKIDVLANLVFTSEHDNFADFSIAHLSLPGVIYIRKGDDSIRTAEDLRAKRFAAVPGSYSHDIAVKHGWGQNLFASTSPIDCLRRLDAGGVDAVIATRFSTETIIKEQNLTRIQPAPFAIGDIRFRYHLAVLRGQDQLLQELNTGLIALRNNGVYDDLYEKWISPLEPRKLRWTDFRPYQFPSIILILALLTAFWLQRRLLSRMRHQAAALKTSEERLTLALEGSQDAFWDWDIATNKVARSERWTLMLNHPELTDTGIEALDSLIHPDDLAHARHARELTQTQGHARTEYRIRDRNGRWLWILDRGKVVARDANGRPSRITGAATDITARKRIEEALGRSQALLEQSQRAAEIGGWEYDVATDQFYWTLQAFRIHDLDSEVVSPSLDLLFSLYKSTTESVIRNAFQNALKEGVSFDIELEMQTASQRPIWVRTIGRAEKNTTQVVRIYGSFQDITHRKKADEERQKLQAKMQEAQKLESLGVLAGGIAHDFNNLLTVIMGNASLAKENPNDVPAALHQIETATQRAADLCRQMLAYAGKGRTTMECIDLNTIVTDTTHLLRLSISKTAALE